MKIIYFCIALINSLGKETASKLFTMPDNDNQSKPAEPVKERPKAPPSEPKPDTRDLTNPKR